MSDKPIETMTREELLEVVSEQETHIQQVEAANIELQKKLLKALNLITSIQKLYIEDIQ